MSSFDGASDREEEEGRSPEQQGPLSPSQGISWRENVKDSASEPNTDQPGDEAWRDRLVARLSNMTEEVPFPGVTPVAGGDKQQPDLPVDPCRLLEPYSLPDWLENIRKDTVDREPSSMNARFKQLLAEKKPSRRRVGSATSSAASLSGYTSGRTSGSLGYTSARTSAAPRRLPAVLSGDSARSSGTSGYVSARTSGSSGYVSARTSNRSAANNAAPTHLAEIPLFNSDLRLNIRALRVSRPMPPPPPALMAAKPRPPPPPPPARPPPSPPPPVSDRLHGTRLDLALLQRLKHISSLRKEDFDLCREPWALGSLCHWLQGIFPFQCIFTYEELILALSALFLCKSLSHDTTEALDFGTALAWRFRTEDPPILSVTGNDICVWIHPQKTLCGVLPSITGGGCYSQRGHDSTAASPAFLRCYSTYCSGHTVRQPTRAQTEHKPEQISNSKESPSPSDWLKLLKAMDLFPPLNSELDWSGRGQHADFKRLEQIPLHVEKGLGHGGSALVESVMCRRIRLARKTVRCGRRLKREDAIKEVAHLQRAQHAHIVRIVGTYVIEKVRDLFILMYPVAEYHLNDFIDEELDPVFPMTLVSFFPCLASTLAFLHEKHHIKHMDIKPENILVRDIRNTTTKHQNRPYKVYIADFGISRSYASFEESETNSITSFTPLYAAPEVVNQDTRGFKADVFSLGCVFTEIVAAIYSLRDELAEIRERSGRYPFHANIPVVQLFLYNTSRDAGGIFGENIFLYISRMIGNHPENRPSAADVRDFLENEGLICKEELPEAFEVAQPLSEY